MGTPTSSPTVSREKEEAGTTEAALCDGHTDSPSTPIPQSGTSPSRIWGGRWWQIPLPRAAAAAPPLPDRAGTDHLGGSSVPQRGGTPGARALPSLQEATLTASRTPSLFLLIIGEKGDPPTQSLGIVFSSS